MTLKRVGAEVRQLGHLRLWRDDLAEMVAVIRQYEPDIAMSVKNYSLDDIDDLAQLGDAVKVDDFVLKTDSGRIRLELSQRRAQLEVNSTDLATRGVAAEIERIAKTRRRPSYRYRFAIASGLALVGVAAFLVGNAQHSRGGHDAAAIVAALAIVGSVMAVGIYNNRPSGVSISVRTRAEAPPWFRRNRDALVTNAIVSAISLVIGYLLGKI